MKNLMEYKGYHTKIEFDAESMSLRGKIEGINDYIDFESEDISNIEKEFHAAVDDYLKFCKEVGKDPEKEYKGVKYKEGYYESWVITLGEGEGNNWWCVLFPPLCLVEAEEADEVEYKFFIKELIDKYL